MKVYYNPLGYAYQQRKNVVKYFREKGALTAAKAIPMSAMDWSELEVNPKQSNIFLGDQFRYLKQHSDGKYWLDEQELESVMQRQAATEKRYQKIFMYIMIAVGIMMLVAMVFVCMLTLSALGIIAAAGSFISENWGSFPLN